MKMDLNLKQLDGDPSDTQIGAAAVGLMADAVNTANYIFLKNYMYLNVQVRAKGPEETQVNALTGFSQQIMSENNKKQFYNYLLNFRFDQ